MISKRLAFALTLSLPVAPAGAETLGLLPQPRSIVEQTGQLQLKSGATITIPRADKGADRAASQLAALMQKTPHLRMNRAAAGGIIRFVRRPGFQPEGYRLRVDRNHATISASDDAGLFYGAVTLWQLASTRKGAIPAVTINDAPRFAWRGLLLDSARNFQSPAFIKTLLDAMAAHKLNRLQWHLVDDQGWRIEIRKYPRLTAIGAWRRLATAPGAPPLPAVGGFYTQAQIREIVAYAAARNITIVPEIEMPGHALSAIRAYPWLGANTAITPGIESHWGVFNTIYNVDDRTFGFLEDVLDEVMSLFPSRYIHVGGDEAVKDAWRASPEIQRRIKSLGLADENALQGWFTKRIERFLSTHNRRLIGWDEILEGGIPSGAVVMSWHGIDGAITAASSGHDAILAASPTLYFDHLQGATAAEGPGRGPPITLADVYAFDPAPAAVAASQLPHILGLQGNLWTEHVRGDERAALMAFPRASAVAELGWSPQSSHDFASFAERLVPQLERLHALGLAPSMSAFTPSLVQQLGANGASASVTLTNQTGVTIRYTTDGAAPTRFSTAAQVPITVGLPTRIRAASFANGQMVGADLDTIVDAVSVRRRDDRQLRLCDPGISLALEDDAPGKGKRASFQTNILAPCWIYDRALLDDVRTIRINVGQLPFNFQIGRDMEKIRYRKPATLAGEFEIRTNNCDGNVIATLPLGAAANNPAVSTLSATIAPQSGSHDLCITYTANGPDPLWAIQSIELLTQ